MPPNFFGQYVPSIFRGKRGPRAAQRSDPFRRPHHHSPPQRYRIPTPEHSPEPVRSGRHQVRRSGRRISEEGLAYLQFIGRKPKDNLRRIDSQKGPVWFMFCNCGTGAGAVYRARLESVCWVKPTEGSNPSLSVALARTGCLTSRRGRTDGSQGNGGPIPPCPTLLRPAVRDFEGLGGQGVSHPGGEERKARGQV